MKSHFKTELNQAFVVGPDDLKKLIDLLNDRIGNVVIRVECADDVTRTFPSYRELVDYENAKGSEINRVRLNAESEDYSKRAAIEFLNYRWLGIQLDFKARDDVVSRLRSKSLEVIAGTKPWYSVLSRIDYFAASLLTMVLAVSVLAVVTFIIQINTKPPEDFNAPEALEPVSSIPIGLPFLASLFLIIFGYILNLFRHYCFPSGVFTIGQGKSRHRHTEKIQWGIVITFFVSLLAGMALLAAT